MFNKLFARLSRDIGIDLGTANTLVYVKDKGIVINEPSIVAINTRSDQILAIGEDAKKMVGKTPPHIIVSRPLIGGVISDFEVAQKMLKYFIEKVQHEGMMSLPRPRVVIGIPLDVTEVEKKAVEDAVLQAGAREAYLIEEPTAAAIGARLPVQEASGNIIVDIGGGTTEIAVISLGGVVTWKSTKIAGDKLNEDIINYVRDNFNLLLGEKTAEEIKIKIGSVLPSKKSVTTKIKGRDLLTGLPREVTITEEQVRDALARSVKFMVDNIRDVIEATPPELVADIYERGIVLSGGGALLRGLDKLIHQEIQIPVCIVDDPLTAVVRGTGLVLEDLENLKDIIVPSASEETSL